MTPIRQQYLHIKQQYPNTIVFFRLGDFYETFDDDARLVAGELELVLTSRPVAKGERVPMTGVPYQSALKSVQFWAEADGCTASATQQENDRLIQQMYAGCKSNSAVWFYSVKKLGHAWPDQFELNAQNISTAGLIWSFLSSHTKR